MSQRDSWVSDVRKQDMIRGSERLRGHTGKVSESFIGQRGSGVRVDQGSDKLRGKRRSKGRYDQGVR